MLYVLTKGDSFLNRQHQIEALGRDGEKHPAYYLNRAAIFQGGEIGVTQEPPRAGPLPHQHHGMGRTALGPVHSTAE